MLTTDDIACIGGVAGACGLEPAALAAVVAVESDGRTAARVAGRDEPLIRWEGHYFDRLCPAPLRARARKSGLASPRAGAIPNPPTQAARWALLRRAAALDHDAAYASCSWGVGQVMGAHWRDLGYRDVDAFVAEARSGLAGQVRLMTLFIAHAGLSKALEARDWQAFARGYNGPAFRRNGYDAKLARAYARLCAGGAGGTETAVLRLGAQGAAVVDLQQRLSRAGLAVAADGLFGARTAAAVRTFQARAGLPADGLAGPRTLAALAANRPAAGG